MTKLKLPIIIALVVVAGVAGLFVSGIIGGGKAEGPVKKHVIEPVPLAEPFTVNLADSDADHYLVVGLALQLAPMDEVAFANFSGAGGGGHGGGAKEAPGALKVAGYPKFRDAVIDVASGFTSAKLRTSDGKAQFKDKLLQRFAAIHDVDEAEHKSSPEDPAGKGVEPPYDVQDVTFTQFTTQ